MHPNIRNYRPEDFEAWLDLTALSAIELNEEYLVWNSRPQLSKDSYQFVLTNENDQLVASVDLEPNEDQKYFSVKQWACRAEVLPNQFSEFLIDISYRVNSPIHIWVSTPKVLENIKSHSKEINQRVLFFIEGSFQPIDQKTFGYCDHIFANAEIAKWQIINENFPVVKKDYLSPKIQTCLEISFILT